MYGLILLLIILKIFFSHSIKIFILQSFQFETLFKLAFEINKENNFSTILKQILFYLLKYWICTMNSRKTKKNNLYLLAKRIGSIVLMKVKIKNF